MYRGIYFGGVYNEIDFGCVVRNIFCWVVLHVLCGLPFGSLVLCGRGCILMGCSKEYSLVGCTRRYI